jgi:hypothetical protein
VTGVIREFMNLYGRMQMDMVLPKAAQRRIIPIFDNDRVGRECFEKVTDPDLPFVAYQDVFLLRRAYPALKMGSPNYQRRLEEMNAPWIGIDCEIEDLLSEDLLEAFITESPGSVRSARVCRENGHHYDIVPQAKGPLVRFARDYGTVADLRGVIRTLQYFRGLFDLPIGPEVL